MADGSIKIDTKIDQNGVKSGLKEMNSNIRDTMGKLASFGKASLGVMAVAIGAIATATGKWLKEADRIDKVSQQIGLTKKTFQELDYVMMQNGASIDAFSIGAKTLQQNMVSNAQAFKTLGVEIKNADGSMRKQDDVMKDVVRRFEGMKQGVEKSALAQDIFGRSAQDLMPMLNQQSGSMDELIKKAHDMGAVMSDDAVTAAVVLGDTISDLKTSISSLLNTVIAPFVPALQKVAEWMSNLSGSVSGTIGSHTQLSKETKTLIEATNNYKTSVQNLDSAQKNITDTERTLLIGRKELARLALEKALAETSKGYAKTAEQVAKLKKEEADRISAVGRYSSLMKQLEIIANGPASAARAASEALGISITSARESYGKAARGFESENLKLIETQTKLSTVSTEQAEAIAEIARAVNDGTLNIDIYKTTNRALYDEIMASAEAQKLLNETIDDAPPGSTEIDEKALDDAIKAQEEYEKAIDISNAKANAGLITQEENTENVNSAARRYMDTLLSLGYRFGDMTTQGGQALEQLREDLKLTTEETAALTADVSGRITTAMILALNEIDRQAKMTKAAGVDAAKTFLVNFAKGMKSNLSKATNAVKNAVGNIAKAARTGFKLFSSLIRFNPQAALDDLQVFLDDIKKFFTTTLPAMPIYFKAGKNMIADFLRGMRQDIGQTKTIIGNVIGEISMLTISSAPQLIADGFFILLKLMEGLAGSSDTISQTIVEVIGFLAGALIANADDIIKLGLAIVAGIIVGVFQAMPSLAQSILDGFIDLFTEADLVSGILIVLAAAIAGYAIAVNAAAIATAVMTTATTIATAAQMAWNVAMNANPIGLVVAGIAALTAVILLLIANWEEVTAAVGGFFSVIKDVGMNLINGLIEGIKAAASGIWNGIKSVFTGIVDAIKGFFGIHSPSTVFAGIGGNMIQGLINGILSAGGAIWSAVKGVFTGLLDNIKNVFSGALDLGKSVVSAIGDGVKGVASGAVELAKDAGGAIVSGAKAAGSAIVSGVKTAGGALASGASAVGGAIASGASSVVSGAGKALKKLKFWATGTESAPPGLAVVGENGPELVQLRGGERIYPAGETSSILSSIMGGLQSFMGGGSLGGSNGLTIHNMITAPVVIDGRQTARAVYENWDKVAK